MIIGCKSNREATFRLSLKLRNDHNEILIGNSNRICRDHFDETQLRIKGNTEVIIAKNYTERDEVIHNKLDLIGSNGI